MIYLVILWGLLWPRPSWLPFAKVMKSKWALSLIRGTLVHCNMLNRKLCSWLHGFEIEKHKILVTVFLYSTIAKLIVINFGLPSTVFFLILAYLLYLLCHVIYVQPGDHKLSQVLTPGIIPGPQGGKARVLTTRLAVQLYVWYTYS